MTATVPMVATGTGIWHQLLPALIAFCHRR